MTDHDDDFDDLDDEFNEADVTVVYDFTLEDEVGFRYTARLQCNDHEWWLHIPTSEDGGFWDASDPEKAANEVARMISRNSTFVRNVEIDGDRLPAEIEALLPIYEVGTES